MINFKELNEEIAEILECKVHEIDMLHCEPEIPHLATDLYIKVKGKYYCVNFASPSCILSIKDIEKEWIEQ